MQTDRAQSRRHPARPHRRPLPDPRRRQPAPWRAQAAQSAVRRSVLCRRRLRPRRRRAHRDGPPPHRQSVRRVSNTGAGAALHPSSLTAPSLPTTGATTERSAASPLSSSRRSRRRSSTSSPPPPPPPTNRRRRQRALYAATSPAAGARAGGSQGSQQQPGGEAYAAAARLRLEAPWREALAGRFATSTASAVRPRTVAVAAPHAHRGDENVWREGGAARTPLRPPPPRQRAHHRARSRPTDAAPLASIDACSPARRASAGGAAPATPGGYGTRVRMAKASDAACAVVDGDGGRTGTEQRSAGGSEGLRRLHALGEETAEPARKEKEAALTLSTVHRAARTRRARPSPPLTTSPPPSPLRCTAPRGASGTPSS